MKQTNSPLLEVEAVEILTAITETSPKTPVYTLRHKKIVGPLDLRHRTISRAIDITDCVFADKVDLRATDFSQTLNLSRNEFQRSFNAGDDELSNSVFKKDFICRHSQFEEGASFSGVRCDGRLLLDGAHFLDSSGAPHDSKPAPVSFVSASIGAIECVKSIFEIPVTFRGAQFKSYGDFERARFKSRDQPVDFSFTSVRNVFTCARALFEGGASFQGMRCEGLGSFAKTYFRSRSAGVNFRLSSFAGVVNFSGAAFLGGVTFNGMKCQHAVFARAKFCNRDTKAIFTLAAFEMGLDCEGAIFEATPLLDSVNCGGHGRFDEVRFRVSDEQPPKMSFALSKFGVNLSLKEGIFGGEVDLQGCQVGGTLVLDGAEFKRLVKLNKGNIGRLKWEGEGLIFPHQVDLRDSTIEVFDLPPGKWRETFDSQEQGHFSRDPYLQLEQYYQKIANDDEARKVYFEGRRKLRSQANQAIRRRWRHAWRFWMTDDYQINEPQSNVNWSIGKWVGDGLLKTLTGYGVQTWRLLLIIVAVLVLSIWIFSAETSLRPKPTNSKTAPPQASAGGQPAGDSPGAGAAGEERKRPSRLERVIYPIETFIPVLKLDVADRWQPATSARALYLIVHRVVGWLLIPLLIASLSGIVKRQ